MQLSWPLRIAFVLALVACSRRDQLAAHRGAVSLHGGYYIDDDHNMVGNGSVRARVPITSNVSVNARYGIDIVSAASVDVVASASRVFEQRHDIIGGISASTDPRTMLRANYRASREPDYQSDGATLTFDRETGSRMQVFHAEVRARYDRVGPGYVLPMAAPMVSTTAAGSLTQVLDRFTLLRVALQTDFNAGFMESPYRYVFIRDAAYSENVPDVRVRHATLVRLQRSLASTLAVFAEYNFTLDNWGVQAHSGEAGFSWELGRSARLDARSRWTVQTAASFYQSRYAQLTDLRTRDRMLGPMLTWWPRVALRINLPAWPGEPQWEFGVAASMLRQLYDDFAPLAQRTAGVFEVWTERVF